MLTWIPAPPEGSLPPIVNTAGMDMPLAQGADEYAHLYPFGPPAEEYRDNDRIERFSQQPPDSPGIVLTIARPTSPLT